MQLKRISVKNFRLLHDVDLFLEKQTTVIVGRNNSGKTSLTEVMKRVLTEPNPTFRIEDFSFAAHQNFWDAYLAVLAGDTEPDIRQILPAIEIGLTFSYGTDEPFGLLSDFIVDLNPDCTEALIVVRYALKEGQLGKLFAGFTAADEKSKLNLFSALQERLPSLYASSFAAVDPNDATNEKAIDGSALKALCASGFISAQRGLDDATQKERVVIGKVLENLFATAKINPADAENYNTAQALETAVKEIQDKIGDDFNQKLDELLPALSIFGYPRLSDPKLRTKTTLDVGPLLSNHTKVLYTGTNGIHLPETYNGLGTRNIILILLQLLEFFNRYSVMEPKPIVQVVFIEEPEVHLHPQMQEVFIRKLGEIAEEFSKKLDAPWPVQFVVSTHSSHVANESHFETIRYFLSSADSVNGMYKTDVKDLRKGLSGKAEPDRSFLHQYMTLTRCDLFFADKAILIEGTTERLLLPRIVRMIDENQADGKKLGSQYVSTMEVGGAYAHIFFDLLEFLELRALVITDIDTVGNDAKACQVMDGEKSSNACIKSWFADKDIKPSELLAADNSAKIVGKHRLAYQIPEEKDGPCGRSFEDAFMLANTELFTFAGPSPKERETQAWEEAKGVKKSKFALDYALTDDNWNIPRYISEGLVWLAEEDVPPTAAILPNTGGVA